MAAASGHPHGMRPRWSHVKVWQWTPPVIDKELDKMYRKAKKEYEKEFLQWEIDLKIAIKERRLPNSDLRPDKPQRQCVVVSPNTSKNQLIIDVKNAGEDGLAIVSSEIDTMVESLNTYYGNMQPSCACSSSMRRSAAFNYAERVRKERQGEEFLQTYAYT